MIYDIISAVIFVLLIVYGVRRGAARTLAGLLVTFVSYTGATFLGKLISVNIYNLVLRPTIHDTVVSTVSDFSHASLQDALAKIDISKIDFLNLQDTIKGAISDGMSGPIDEISANAGKTAETVVEPIVIGVMSFFITIFLFFLLWFLLSKFVLPLLLKVFRLPVIRQIDMVLGGVLGAAEAFLLICMLAYLLKLVIPQITTDLPLLQEETIYKSFIFKHLYDGNIFSTFASWLSI